VNTGPSRIAVRQNTSYARDLLAAQSRLYSDAKIVHDVRVAIVTVLSLATIVAGILLPDLRIAIGAAGGACAFAWSILAGDRETRKRREAAAIQEVFDTYVFEIPWNDIAIDRPSPTSVAEAAARYRGNRTNDWYPDTQNVKRPLAILICQRSNLGWGSSMHRFYAACLLGATLLLTIIGIALVLTTTSSVTEALTSVLVPLLAPYRELIEMIRANREGADTKAKLEGKILGFWSKAMTNCDNQVAISDCRAIQDRILGIRQVNAHIPDWIDNKRRVRSEAAMHKSAQQLVEEAVQCGQTSQE
jgi:hypothetical protein